ncbi:hypothetical protein PYCC9005_001850 [Savitreella phatthalungensis]
MITYDFNAGGDGVGVMPSSCRDIREAIAECLRTSPCLQNAPAGSGRTGADCLKDPYLRANEVPEPCLLLLKNFYDCKRGLLDMRKRFRGNAPVVQREDAEDEVPV